MIFHLFRLDLENENFESIPKIVSEQVELCFGKRKKKMASWSTTSTTLFSSTPKALSSTNPISQTLTIPKSFNGLCKPLKSQPSRSISLSNKLSLLVQALWSSWFKPLPLPLIAKTPNHRLNMDDTTDGQKTRSFIFSIQALDVWFVVSLTHHIYLSL